MAKNSFVAEVAFNKHWLTSAATKGLKSMGNTILRLISPKYLWFNATFRTSFSELHFTCESLYMDYEILTILIRVEILGFGFWISPSFSHSLLNIFLVTPVY